MECHDSSRFSAKTCLQNHVSWDFIFSTLITLALIRSFLFLSKDDNDSFQL